MVKEVTVSAIGMDAEMKRRLNDKLLSGMAEEILANSKDYIKRLAQDLLKDPDFLDELHTRATSRVSYEFEQFLHRGCQSEIGQEYRRE